MLKVNYSVNKSYITFDDLKNDPGIQTHWTITALFLCCFGKIATLKTKSQTIYLNKASFEAWKKRHNIKYDDSDTAADIINKVCAAHFTQKATAALKSDPATAMDHFQAAAERGGNAAEASRIAKLKAWISTNNLGKDDYQTKLTECRNDFNQKLMKIKLDSIIYPKTFETVSGFLAVIREAQKGSPLTETSTQFLHKQGFNQPSTLEIDQLIQNLQNLNLKSMMAVYHQRYKNKLFLHQLNAFLPKVVALTTQEDEELENGFPQFMAKCHTASTEEFEQLLSSADAARYAKADRLWKKQIDLLRKPK